MTNSQWVTYLNVYSNLSYSFCALQLSSYYSSLTASSLDYSYFPFLCPFNQSGPSYCGTES